MEEVTEPSHAGSSISVMSSFFFPASPQPHSCDEYKCFPLTCLPQVNRTNLDSLWEQGSWGESVCFALQLRSRYTIHSWPVSPHHSPQMTNTFLTP